MKIAITGHRPNKLGNDYDLTGPLIGTIRKKIYEVLRDCITSGYPDIDNMRKQLTLITGMALGIDTLFAQLAIELDIPFIAAIPFAGQYRKWQESSVRIYHDILIKAQSIQVVDINKNVNYSEYCKLPETAFSNKKMQDRNIWMVDNCNLLIAVWDGSSGGTKNCVDYAMTTDKTVIRINPLIFLSNILI